MIKKFNAYEQPGKSVVFAFGRFNPPTTGHEKLINKVKQVAGSDEYKIYPSFSQNQNKDPLPHALKIAYMRKMFPKHKRNIIADRKAITAIDIATKLYDQGFRNLRMVAGSDRVKEFETLLKKYNGVEGKRHGFYKFDNIDVVSAGERDPDAEGVSGMSASKMRYHANKGEYDDFADGLPKGFKDGRKLFRDVRKYMGIREQKDMGVMNEYEELRDRYLTGQIWKIGDLVEAKGIEGKIIQRGTNYITFNDSQGKVHKAWLHEIKVEQKKITAVRQDKDVKDKPGTQPAKYYSGVKKKTKDARAAHFRKGAKMDDDNPAAYKPAPGDSKGKTKPSQYTKKFKKMFGDSYDIGKDYGDHTRSVTPGENKKLTKEDIEGWYKNEDIHEKYELRYGDNWYIKLTETYNKLLEKVEVVHDNCGTPDCCGQCADANITEQKKETLDSFGTFILRNAWGEIVESAEFEGRKVKLNDPIRTSENPNKKFKVYVKNEKGNVVVVRFGDPNLEIKRDDPARRKSFRARHNCDNPGPKTKARYWSCQQWRAGAKVDN
jgi:hypothetical protein|tara:strand:+ start:16995 stop:18635 length:1641 start_codon:yes stop_codon:yes gene_type:complete